MFANHKASHTKIRHGEREKTPSISFDRRYEPNLSVYTYTHSGGHTHTHAISTRNENYDYASQSNNKKSEREPKTTVRGINFKQYTQQTEW